MQKLEVFGANKLKGQIKISGSKNASLPILASTLLSNKKIILKKLPKVRDITTMLMLLQSLGSKIKFYKNQILIETISCFKRAGCNGVLTYFAYEIAKFLNTDK